MKKLLTLILSCLLLLSICSALQSCQLSYIYSEGNGELNVLCTSFVPFDLARNIGGEHISVSILQDSGSDLHNYTPTVETLNAISEADVFIYIGGVSDEAWVYEAINASANKDIITLRLIDDITPIHADLSNDWTSHNSSSDSEHGHESDSHDHDHDHDHDHNGHSHGADEHIWTSLKNAATMVESITECLCSADPKNATLYKTNAAEYTGKILDLDEEYTSFFESVSTKTFVFADRFPFVYLMHDYHIPYIAAFSGCSTEINSSFEMQINLIETVRKTNCGFIITIEGNDKSLAQAISAETGCKIITLNSLQSVKRSEIQNGINYLSIMKQNLNALKEANQ